MDEHPFMWLQGKDIWVSSGSCWHWVLQLTRPTRMDEHPFIGLQVKDIWMSSKCF
ncbi:unnamed protein product, partial [Aphanomyces euteiches]